VNELSSKSKACSKCGVVKPATEELFYRAKANKSGIKARCRSCANADAKIYYADPDKEKKRIAKATERLRNLSDPFSTCIGCNAIKPATSDFFYRSKNTKSGIEGTCRSCRSAYQKTYYEQNFEQICASQKIYNKADPERYKATARSKNRRRKAKRLNNGFEIYTEFQVLDLFGTDCYICKEPIDLEASRKCGIEGWQRSLHIDHVLPMSKGGPDTLSNVRPSHAECNLIKGSKDGAEHLKS
jgi:5-methylcytosine-specific restriction endonuclease McrA